MNYTLELVLVLLFALAFTFAGPADVLHGLWDDAVAFVQARTLGTIFRLPVVLHHVLLLRVVL